jgi:hypothetical protein
VKHDGAAELEEERATYRMFLFMTSYLLLIHDIPEAYRLLGPTILRINFFHIHGSGARWNRSCPLHLHRSVMLSSHSLHERSLLDFQFIFANTVCLISLLSSILQMWPNNLSFLFLTVSIILEGVGE